MADPVPMKLYSILSAEAVKGMNGNRGRMTTQAAHGFVHALWDAGRYFPEDVETYRNQPSAFKVTLVAPDSETLRALHEKYKGKCGTSLVEETGSKSDGSTNEAVKAVTALGIGPLRVTDACDDLKALKSFL